MNDELYKDFIQNQLNENEDSYFADIKHDKNLLWNRIDKNKIIPFWFYYAAATILLIIGMGFFFSIKMKYRDNEILKLQAQINWQNKKLSPNRQKSYNKIQIVDTLKIVNEKIVYQTKQMIDTIVLHDTLTDLVIKKDTIFIINNPVEQIADNEMKADNIAIKKSEMPINQVSHKKNREKRFIFLFGKPRNDAPIDATAENRTAGLITLKSK